MKNQDPNITLPSEKQTKKEVRPITWDDYIHVLEINSKPNWYQVSWIDHITIINPFLIKKNISPLEQYSVKDEMIISKLLSQMAYTDGKVVEEERTFITNLNETLLTNENSVIKQNKFEKNFDITAKQIFIFYLLLNIALSDDSLVGEEIEQLCTLSEFLGITNKILTLINIYRDKNAGRSWQTKIFTAFDVSKQDISTSAKKIEDLFQTGDSDGNKEFKKRSDDILNVTSQLRKADVDKNLCDQLQSIASQVGNGRLNIGIVGITSSGKTALMNALLGENLLPESVAPTTNLEVKVRRSTNRRAVVSFFDLKQQIWKGASLLSKLQTATNEKTNPNNEMGIESIELEHPDFLLPETLEVIDTPGLNALGHEDHAEITMKQVLPQLDMIVYLTTVTNSLKNADMNFIRIAKKRMAKDQKLLFIITCKGKEKNTKDISKEEKWNQQIERLRKDLDENELGEDKAGIALVDNLWGQWGRLGYLQAWKDSGFVEMLSQLSEYAQDLRVAWLYLQSKKALDLIQQKVLSPLEVKLSENSLETKKSIRILDSKIENIEEISERLAQEYSNMKKEFVLISKNINISLSKPDNVDEFNQALKKMYVICTKSLTDISNISDKNSTKGDQHLKKIDIKPAGRRERVRKPELPNQPSSAIEKRIVKKKGLWNWLKGFVDMEDYETHYNFDPEKSYQSLLGYRSKLSEKITDFKQNSLNEFERKYVNASRQELANNKSARKSFNTEKNSKDTDLKNYLQGIINNWIKLVDDQKYSIKSMCHEKQVHPIPKTKTGDKEVLQHHHIYSLLKRCQLNKKHLLLFGGPTHKSVSWIKEAYDINLRKIELESAPFWLNSCPDQFPEKYPVINDELENHNFNILVYPETTKAIKIQETIIDYINKSPDWSIGIYIDVNRIGSGLSDIKNNFSNDLKIISQLSKAGKIFFWNTDMGHFESCDRLFELITTVREMLIKNSFDDVPTFFSESGDLRWSYLLYFANEWFKYPNYRNWFSRQWSHNEYSTSAPFLPATLSELESRFAQHIKVTIL